MDSPTQRTPSRSLVVSLVAALFLASTCSGCQPQGMLQSQEGKFSVQMPGNPKETEDVMETPSGSRRVHNSDLVFVSENPFGVLKARLLNTPLAYGVSYVALTVDDHDAWRILESLQRDRLATLLAIAQALRENPAPRTTFEQELQLGSFRGHEVVVEGRHGAWRMRFYASPTTCYKVEVWGSSLRQVRSSAANRFFDSFKIRVSNRGHS